MSHKTKNEKPTTEARAVMAHSRAYDATQDKTRRLNMLAEYHWFGRNPDLWCNGVHVLARLAEAKTLRLSRPADYRRAGLALLAATAKGRAYHGYKLDWTQRETFKAAIARPA